MINNPPSHLHSPHFPILAPNFTSRLDEPVPAQVLQKLPIHVHQLLLHTRSCTSKLQYCNIRGKILKHRSDASIVAEKSAMQAVSGGGCFIHWLVGGKRDGYWTSPTEWVPGWVMGNNHTMRARVAGRGCFAFGVGVV